ncbi:unnamed protein product [Diamesa serratosioi]
MKLCLSLSLSLTYKHINIHTQNDKTLTRAVVDIVLNFYVKTSSNINIYEAAQDPESMKLNYDIINEILYHVQSKIVIYLEGYIDLKIMNQKRVYNLLFVDSHESFLQVFRLMTPEYFNYQGFYLIVITKYTSDQYYMMQQIFDMLWAEYIINVNIIWATPMNHNEAIMFTYYPYTDFYCGKTYPIQLNQYRSNRWLHLHSVHFPNKIQNLYGCKLKVSTLSTPPFMMTREENGETVPDGIDGTLLRVLSQRMNFSVELTFVDDLWGNIYDNGTVTGAIKLVVENDANFTIGYYAATASRNKIMTSSYVYYTSNLVFIVPPGRLYTSFEKLFYPFKLKIWSLVTIIMLTGFLVIVLLKFRSIKTQNFVFGRGNQSPCLNIINVFFGGSLHLLPTRNFARFLLGLFMIYCLIIRSSYQGALFKFMQTDSRAQPASSIDEMLERDFLFYMLESVMLNVNELHEIHDKLIDSDFKGALLSSEEHAAYLNVISKPNRHYKYSPQVVFAFNLVIYMRQQSCLQQEFNEQILALTGGGFLESWTLRFIDKDRKKEQDENEPTQLNMSQLLGGYELLLLGLSIATFTFLMELVSYRFKSLRLIPWCCLVTKTNEKMKFNLVIICCVVKSIYFVESSNLFQLSYHNSITSQAVGDFILNVYLNDTPTVNICSAPINDNQKLVMDDIINEIIMQSESVFQIEEYSFLNASNEKRFHNVILIGNYASFRHIYNCLLADNFVYQGYFLFVLVDYYHEQYVEMAQVLEDLWQIYIVNVNILMRTPLNNILDMFTYYPFTPTYCGKVYPVLINQFINSQFQNAGNYFVDTVKNFHQCTLSVATFNIIPLMMVEITEQTFKLTGIDGYVLQAIAKQLNFTIELVYVTDDVKWGIVYSNGSSTGAIQKVLEGPANFTIGKYSMSHVRNKYLDPSAVYFSSPLIMIIPPGRPLSPFENLMKPFTQLMWLILICILLIAFSVIAILKWKFNETIRHFVLGANNKHPFLNVLSVLLGVCLQRTPNRNFARTLLCVFMLFCLVIRSSYQGALFEILKTDNRDKMMDSIDELIAEDFDFLVLESLTPLLTGIPRILDRKIIIKSSEVPEIRLKTMNPDFKGTLLSSLDQVLYSNKITYNNHTLNVCKEELFRMQYCIYSRKNSYLPRLFTDVINSFAANGLINEISRHYIDYKYIKNFNPKEPKQFPLYKVMGGFEILATGLLIASITCLMEIVSKRVQFLQRFFDIL